MKGRSSERVTQPPDAESSPQWGRGRRTALTLAAGLFLVSITVAAYLPAVRCGYIWDDDLYVQNNATLRSTDGLRRIWFELGATSQYYPLVYTSYWLEYRCWRLDPTGYHVVNIFLHAAVTVLLWRILKVLGVPGGWIAAAVFALHPVHVESVAWITERKNVLSGAFYLSAALAYLRYALPPEDRSRRAGLRRFYVVSLVLFACALLSKSVTCTLPAVLLLLLWWKRKRLTRQELVPLAPFFALGIAMGLLTIWVEKRHVGAEGAEWNLTFVERCLIAGRALCFYAGKLVWPRQLIFIYPRWQIDAGTWWPYLYPVAAIVVLAALFLGRRRLGLGPVVAALCFAGTLFPALGFFDVYPMRFSFVADHFQYLASAALIALVVAAGHRAASGVGRWGKGIGTVAAAFMLLTLGTLTWRQGQVYRDQETLWRDTLRKNPDAWMAHNNLGIILQARGELSEAIDHYRQALVLKPDHVKAHNNLGVALRAQGATDEAIGHFIQAISLKPDHAGAHANLASALASQGRWPEAVSHYRQALQINADLPEAHYGLGLALQSLGRFDEAVEQYRRTLDIRPDFVKARAQLGGLLAARGEVDEAILHLRQALEAEQALAEVHYNLGLALKMTGRIDEGLGHLREAVKLDPDSVAALNTLAWVLATDPAAHLAGPDEAIRLARHAAELTQYKSVEVLDTLAAAYAAAGEFGPAILTAQRALTLASSTQSDDAVEGIRNRLELYRQSRPFQQPTSTPSDMRRPYRETPPD